MVVMMRMIPTDLLSFPDSIDNDDGEHLLSFFFSPFFFSFFFLSSCIINIVLMFVFFFARLCLDYGQKRAS